MAPGKGEDPQEDGAEAAHRGEEGRGRHQGENETKAEGIDREGENHAIATITPNQARKTWRARAFPHNYSFRREA